LKLADSVVPLADLLLDSMWDVVHVLDSEGIIRYITPSIERLLDLPPEELIGRAAAEFVHPDDLDLSQQKFNEAIGTPEWGGSIQLRLRHRDGSWCWVSTSARHVVAGGTPLLIISTHDISDIKEAERSLTAAEERFRILAEQSLVGIYIVSVAGFLYVNPTMAQIFGYTPEEMLGIDKLEVVAEVDRDTVAENIRRRLEGEEETKRYRFRGCRKDGTKIIVEVHGTRAKMDGRTVILGSLVDVTEQVRWEKALQESEERYRRFFEEDLTGDVLTRPDGRIIACNPAFAKMFDLGSVDEAVGMDIATLHPEAGDREILLRRLLKDKAIHGEEVELRRPDGTRIWVLQNVVGSFDQKGELAEIRRYLFDITARKRAEEVVRRLYEEAREAVSARDDILAVVSHDLRNPLNTIVMSASLAMDDTERRAGNRLAMETIKRSAEHMNVLIQDLLDISRMEAGQLRLDPTPLAVTSVLSELEDGYAALAAERSIRFAVEQSDDLPAIQADSDRLRQAFSNLIGNAFKFTPDGGSVVVRAERREEVVCFSVRDSGPGIPASHQSQVFERFWQAKSATRQGAGLGLAITKGIVEAHGGQVWVESEEGRGTAFHFTIPVSL